MPPLVKNSKHNNYNNNNNNKKKHTTYSQQCLNSHLKLFAEIDLLMFSGKLLNIVAML